MQVQRLMINKNRTQSNRTRAGHSMAGFPRRYYRTWGSFWADFKFLMSNRDQIRQAMQSDLITPAFRERLMLAVTEVNQCTYCRKFHVGQARQAGITTEEITQFLKGSIPGDIPEDQKLAVCYAQHWAESDGQSDPELKAKVIEAYGESGYKAISIVMRMIWMGNLLGNTGDYYLYRISFGRLGN